MSEYILSPEEREEYDQMLRCAMSHWWLLLAGALIGAGILALLVVIGAARLAGPDTRDRVPDDDLAVARAAGVVPPDGSHEDLPLSAADVAGELVELYGIWPGAAMYDAEPTVPPIIPGRDT